MTRRGNPLQSINLDSSLGTVFLSEQRDPELQYLIMLKTITPDYPNLGAALNRAETNRAFRFKSLAKAGRQLHALDEILAYTGELERYFTEAPKVSRIAFLLHRVHGDLATAVESFLSGFHKTVLDAMRDVMEIEFLMRDFAITPWHIEEWLTASPKIRHNKFRPAVLRQRYAASKERTASDMPEADDYRGHSGLIHVLPYENFIVGATPGEAADALGSIVCLYDIFEHARRFFAAVGQLSDRLELHCPTPESFLKVAPVVWQECQGLWEQVAPILEGPESE